MSTRHEFEYVSEPYGGGFLGVYVRGHHDPVEVFTAAIREGCASERGVLLEDVRQTRYRKVPSRSHPSWFWLIEGSGRGAFPVTLVDFQAASHRRYLARKAAAETAEVPT